MNESEDRLDLQYIEECFELALKAEGRTAPNPMVGAVVVSKDGVVVGRGFHPKAGEPHAEVFALREAGEQARDGTIYVSLEPCCHHGKTPPCTDAVITSGVRRVVAAQEDPNPKVAGNGMKLLNAAGIITRVSVLEEKAEWINRAFLKRIRTGRPWVLLKMAVTLDGRIADRSGNSRWISGQASRRRTHQLRDQCDAILVGGNTLLRDDPELTTRDYVGGRDPVRIAIDRQLKMGTESRFLRTVCQNKTIVFCDRQKLIGIDRQLPESVEALGVSVKNDRLDLEELLTKLATLGINSVLCEGGGILAGSLLKQELIDEIYWIVAPMVQGDPQAKSAVDFACEVKIADATRFNLLDTQTLEEDVWLHLLPLRDQRKSTRTIS